MMICVNCISCSILYVTPFVAREGDYAERCQTGCILGNRVLFHRLVCLWWSWGATVPKWRQERVTKHLIMKETGILLEMLTELGGKLKLGLNKTPVWRTTLQSQIKQNLTKEDRVKKRKCQEGSCCERNRSRRCCYQTLAHANTHGRNLKCIKKFRKQKWNSEIIFRRRHSWSVVSRCQLNRQFLIICNTNFKSMLDLLFTVVSPR